MADPATPMPPMHDRRLLGIAFRCLAATAFAGMNAALKAASNEGASIAELVFYRSAGAVPLVAAWIAFGPGFRVVRTRRPLAHLTRSVVGCVSITLTFAALAYLPLAEATTLSYSAPVVATILSALVLRESVGGARWTAVLVGFAGMILVMQPGGHDGALPAIGIAYGVAAAFGQSAVMITLRQIGRTENSFAVVFWFMIFCTIVTAPLLAIFGHWHAPHVFAVLIVGGLFGGIGQLAMTASLRFAPVSVVVPFDFLQLLWAALIGWQLFGDPPTAAMLAGAALIAASGIYTAYRERRRGKDPAEGRAVPAS